MILQLKSTWRQDGQKICSTALIDQYVFAMIRSRFIWRNESYSAKEDWIKPIAARLGTLWHQRLGYGPGRSLDHTATLRPGAADTAIGQLPLEVRSQGPVSTCERRVTNVSWVHSHHLCSGGALQRLRRTSMMVWATLYKDKCVAKILNRYGEIFCFQFDNVPLNRTCPWLDASRQNTSCLFSPLCLRSSRVRVDAYSNVFCWNDYYHTPRGYLSTFYESTYTEAFSFSKYRSTGDEHRADDSSDTFNACGDFGTAIRKKCRNLRNFVVVLMPNVVLFQRELEYSPNHPFFGLFAGQNKFGKEVKLLDKFSIQERLSSQRGVTLILVDSSANNKEADCAKRSPAIGALELSRSNPIYRLPTLFPRIYLRTRASRQMCIDALHLTNNVLLKSGSDSATLGNMVKRLSIPTGLQLVLLSKILKELPVGVSGVRARHDLFSQSKFGVPLSIIRRGIRLCNGTGCHVVWNLLLYCTWYEHQNELVAGYTSEVDPRFTSAPETMSRIIYLLHAPNLVNRERISLWKVLSFAFQANEWN
ncbi:hypothetical protein ARMGADRAFT_1036306 [Armillaria gallica]|uniref:Uncharacterized protein n=1 Tax=Armillaria gallica TaxID=47427 RepID=A0A2H3D909_ARMGA|nr:hypothetical protein ARMGADRAFT_1036306 [Armillaria gallica]